MENLISLKMLEENKRILEKRIFTRLQINILRKRLQKKALDRNEKTYYYKFIRPKLLAMMSLFDIRIKVSGKGQILPGRLEQAEKILHDLEQKYKKKKIIISGSFLFNKKYHDIDAFVFTKYDKEDYKKGRLHVSFQKESALDSLFFSSLCQISISNFAFEEKHDFAIGLKDIMQTYEMLINSILNKEDYVKLLKDFILQSEYVSKHVILNPKQLFFMKGNLFRKNSGILSNMFINTLVLGFPEDVLKETLKAQIMDYKRLQKEYKSAKNLQIYIDTYAKVISLVA